MRGGQGQRGDLAQVSLHPLELACVCPLTMLLSNHPGVTHILLSNHLGDTHPSPLSPWHSLDDNRLCGLDDDGRGTFTTKGIAMLCEALKGSAVTSLKCATAPSNRFSAPAASHTHRMPLPLWQGR